MSRLGLGLLSLSMLTCVAGCQKLFGDYHVDDSAFAGRGGMAGGRGGAGGSVAGTGGSAGTGESAGTGGSTTQTVCNEGDRRCHGTAFQECNAERDGWVDRAQCASDVLCKEDIGCQAPTCKLGDFYCDGAELQTCNDDLNGWLDVTQCPSAAYCDPTNRECLKSPCNAGDYRCNGNRLEQCSGDPTAWEFRKECDTPGLCQADNHLCAGPECDAGAYRCSDELLLVCNPDRTGWATAMNCKSTDLCDGANHRCKVCVPNTFECQGDELHQCAADGQSNPLIKTCTSATCDASSGHCCEPDTYSCSDQGDLQLCSSDGLDLTPQQACGAVELCDAMNGSCL
jgi:hypothetical protein